MNADKYKDFSVADFIQDEDFIRWVQDPTPQDQIFWNSMLDIPGTSHRITEAQILVQSFSSTSTLPPLQAEEKQKMLIDMQARIGAGQQFSDASRLRVASRRRILSIAATLLLLIVAGGWLFLGQRSMVEVTTAYGEQQTLTLPDGSEVMLNANSTLQYPKRWKDQESRKVRLSGEAFFTVTQKPTTGQKFQVVTEDLTVEVLGTVFNVNARETDTEVYLEEGKVNLILEKQADEIEMAPGELVIYSKATQLPVKKKLEEEQPASWKDGIAWMKNALLEDIIQKINEIYGVTVLVENEAHLARRFSAGIPVDDPETGYKVLMELTGLNIEKNGKTWTITN